MYKYNDSVIRHGDIPVIEIHFNNIPSHQSRIQVLYQGSLEYSGYLKNKTEKIKLNPFKEPLRTYQIEMQLRDKKFHLEYTLLQLQENEPYIVCDIDFTLSATNIFLYLTRNLLKLKTIYHSTEALSLLSEKYKIIYLTGRIRSQNNITKNWLKMNRYPFGPLIGRSDPLPNNLLQFKSDFLKSITEISCNGVGIGDLYSDISAYLNNHLQAIRIIHPILSYSKDDQYEYKSNYYTVTSWKGIERLFKEKRLLE